MSKKDEHEHPVEKVLGTGAAGDPGDPAVGAAPLTQLPVELRGDAVRDVTLPEKEEKK